MQLLICAEEINPDVASLVSKTLSNHPTLEYLRLQICGLDNSISLRNILGGCERLKELDFSHNNIRSESAAAIAGFISRNDTKTEFIGLRSNQISDSDVPHLVNYLQKITMLTSLNLLANGFTQKGKRW